jgi:Flp pilus assembly protein TadG
MSKRAISLIGRVLRRHRVFARHQRGVTAIEFGLLALPFFTIIAAILETSVVFLASQVLDSSVQDVSRFIRTGQAQAANIGIARFRSEVCERLYNLFADCNGLHVEVRTITDFASVSISPPVDWNCDEDDCGWTRSEAYPAGYAAAPSSIMVVQVYYKWPTLLNFAGLSLANLPDGKRLLGTATVFRNEPFPNG